MSTQPLFEFQAGDDFGIQLRFKNADTTAFAELVNYTIQSTMKRDPRESDETTPAKVDVVPQLGAEGIAYLVFDNEQTAQLQPGLYYMDIQLYDTVNDRVKTIMSDRVRVLRQITQRDPGSPLT